MDRDLVKAYRFFKEHAGYVVGEAARCALQLARAEQWAERNGVTFEWGQDELFSADDFDGAERVRECLVLRATDPDTGSVEVLGGICDPDRTFGRVCEAELACELKEAADKIAIGRKLETSRRF